MNYKPIIVIGGEPNSIFFEIFFKSLKLKNFKSPIILIASKKILKYHMHKLGYNFTIKLHNIKNLNNKKLDNKNINLVNVNFNKKYKFGKISEQSNKYIKDCLNVGITLVKKNISNKILNGPISKKSFLKKRYLGITEYLAKINKVKKFAMLIYNKKLSVCPITTHLPIKMVPKQINKKNLIDKIELINTFFNNHLKIKAKIGITGLNPHNESILKFNEDELIIKPIIKKLKKLNINIEGPIPADTIFMKKNRKKFNIIIGMYHDQVLTPIKTLFEFNAINITLGLPFLRVSPDHGPNESMLGKNSSSPLSLIKSLEFLDN